jgi:tetratricopeptide (TPR) repeat protein
LTSASRYFSTNKSSEINSAINATIVTEHVILDGPIVEVNSPMVEQEFPSQAMILKQRDENLAPQELQLKKALLHHQSLLETRESSDIDTTNSQHEKSLEHLRNCFETLGFWDDALMAEKLLEPYYNNDARSSSLASCIYRQGKLHMLMTDPMQASIQYQKALELFQMEFGNDLYHADIGNVLLAKAGLEFHRQQIDKALQLLLESELHFRNHDGLPQEQSSNHGKGDINSRATAPHPDLVKCLDYQAMMYRLKGEYPTALAKYQEALRLLTNGIDSAGTDLQEKLQSLQLHIADILGTMDDIDGALGYYQTILDQDRQQNGSATADPALEGVILHSMGSLHMQQRKFDLAEQELSRAVELKQRTAGEAHPEVAKSFVALGSVLGVIGKKRKALECFQQALLIERANSDDPNDPEILLILRNIAVLKGDKVAKW